MTAVRMLRFDKIIQFNSTLSVIFLKCFVRCFFKKEGFFDKDDKLNKDFIVEFLTDSVKISRDQLDEVIDKCLESQGDDACSASYRV